MTEARISTGRLERIDTQAVLESMRKELGTQTASPNPKKSPSSTTFIGKNDDERVKLEKYGIYKRFANITFSEIEKMGLPDNFSIKENYKIVKDYAKNIKSYIEQGVGLFLIGDCGTLKTTFSVAIMRQLIDNEDFYYSCYFIPMTSLMDNIYTMQSLSKEEAARFEKKIRTVKLLVIDDLGSENTDVSWVKSKVDSIITERYNRMLSCIISTNLDANALKNTYASRIIDRFKSTNKTLIFKGKSARKEL